MTDKRYGRPAALVAAGLAATILAGTVTGCTSASPIPQPTGVAQETTQTTVFYATGRTILAEQKVVDSRNVYESTLKELLLAEPTEEKNVAIVQPTAKVNSVTVKDGVATVDWDKAVLDFQATADEKKIAYASILLTLGQFPEIDSVRFTVDGKSSGTIDGKKIEDFWGSVSLKGQPFKVMRIDKSKSKAATGTPEATGTAKP